MKISHKQLRKLIEATFDEDYDEQVPSDLEEAISILEDVETTYDNVAYSYGSRSSDYEGAAREIVSMVGTALSLLKRVNQR